MRPFQRKAKIQQKSAKQSLATGPLAASALIFFAWDCRQGFRVVFFVRSIRLRSVWPTAGELALMFGIYGLSFGRCHRNRTRSSISKIPYIRKCTSCLDPNQIQYDVYTSSLPPLIFNDLGPIFFLCGANSVICVYNCVAYIYTNKIVAHDCGSSDTRTRERAN